MNSDKTFAIIKSILEPYEPNLSVIHNKSNNYYLNTPAVTNKKPEFFGAVQIKKLYVAFHLMPVYYHPELLDNTSEALKNRMQGKSCFNFKEIDDELFAELRALTQSSFDKYKSLNKI